VGKFGNTSVALAWLGLNRLKGRPLRTALTIVGIALGVSLFVAIQIVNRSTLASFEESINAVAGKAKLIISAGEAGFEESQAEQIETVPGVKSAVPSVETRGHLLGLGTPGETLTLMGVDLLKEQDVRSYKTVDSEVIDDPLTFLNRPDSVILTKDFAKAHGLDIDSKFEIATSAGKAQLTVRGLLAPEGPAAAYGGTLAIMDIDGARMTFGKKNKVDRVDVVPDEHIKLSELTDRLQKTLGPGFKIEMPASRSAEMEKMISSFQLMLSAFGLIALFVGIFLVANTVSITVAESRREIGIARALGATARFTVLQIFLESFWMGIAGAILGVELGKLVATKMVSQVSRSLSLQYGVPLEVSRLEFSPHDFIWAVLLGSAAAWIASIWPSRKASKIPPAEAMRKSADFAIEAQPGAKPFKRLGGLWGKAFGITGEMAEGNLLRHPRRTLANILSLVVGLAMTTAVLNVSHSFKQTLLDWFDRVLRADVVVSSYSPIPHYLNFSQPLGEELGHELEAVPGINSIFGLRLIHFDYEGETISIKAFDRPDPKYHYDIFDIDGGSPSQIGQELFDSKSPVILISSSFERKFHKHLGDTVTLDTPNGPLETRVIGIMTDFAAPNGVIDLSRELYKKYWKDPLVNVFSVGVKPDVSVETVRREIENRFAESKGLMALSNADMRRSVEKGIDESFQFLGVIELCSLVIALLCLFNTLLISVFERLRELGVLRAIGMSRGQLHSMILQEALIQGVVGSLAGALGGVLLSYFLIRFYLSGALGWSLDFQLSLSSMAQIAGLAVVTALVAGLYPAFRAARLLIREALAHE
jgi:putative ABC transport system permease protein